MRAVSLPALLFVASTAAQPLVPTQSCVLDSILNEASGLLMVEGQLWTVLDSGNPHAIFRVDPATGAVTRTLTVENAVNNDWEDLAMDDEWLYIGDFGNNGGDRTDLRVYRVSLSAVMDDGVTDVSADSILFAYPDQVDFTTAYDANNWDCEAFVARNDSLFLFSKNWLTSDCYLYAMSAEPGVREAIRRDTLPSEGLVTGASLDPSDGAIALIGHTTGYATFTWRLDGYPTNDLFQGINERHAVTAIPMQAEGIVWSAPDSVLFCSEASDPLPSRLWRMELPAVSAVLPRTGDPVPRVFPSPASDLLMIDCPRALYVELYDLSGRIVLRSGIFPGITTFDVSHLPAGRYFLRSNGSPVPLAVMIAR